MAWPAIFDHLPVRLKWVPLVWAPTWSTARDAIATCITEHHGLAVAARAVPRGVICLLSALSFHGIGTQLPSEIWMAIDRRARQPSLRYSPLRIVRFIIERFLSRLSRSPYAGSSFSRELSYFSFGSVKRSGRHGTPTY